MKNIYLFLFFFAFSYYSNGQIFNQDAEGKSSIIGFGGTLNFDIKESLVKANYYKSSLKEKALALGVDVQGKNSEGVAGIFENGTFSPEGEASVMIGSIRAFQNKENLTTSRLIYYTKLGVKTSEFKYDRGNSFTTSDTRFVDTVHTRPKIEVGASLRWGGRLYLGLLLGNSKETNHSSLRKSVYKYVFNDPTLPGLQQTRDITAYSGNYGKYSNTYLNFDAVYLIPSDSIYISPAIYFRYNKSSNENLRSDNSVLGTSLNFINIESGKFFGGVYLQTNDIFRNNSTAFNKTIQFGLIARFSFTTISPF